MSASSEVLESIQNKNEITLKDKMKGSMLGFFIGDALAMPVHWYYNLDQLRKDFGNIQKYEAPKSRFPGSIMNLSNTGGGGRGSDKGSIIGDIILHGKKQYWLRGGEYHYHHGMVAGENTLDALITYLFMQRMTALRSLNIDDFQEQYVKYMTTPGSHNDTYAGTCHRMFFKNYVEGKALKDCPDNDGHNVDSIDSLMIIPPVAIAYYQASKEERDDAIRRAILATRRIKVKDMKHAFLYGDMLVSVLNGESVRNAALNAGRALRIDVAHEAENYEYSDPMTACYIDSAFPAMLIFAYKYEDPQRLLLASANAGGENVARGSLLGALIGAQYGMDELPVWMKEGLHKAKETQIDVHNFIKSLDPN